MLPPFRRGGGELIIPQVRGGATPSQVILFGSKGIATQKGSGDYSPMLREIVKFFQTGIAPVSMEESLEIYAFMEAADESKRQGGCSVKLSDVIQKNGGPP